jgi:hypothetical protein
VCDLGHRQATRPVGVNGGMGWSDEVSLNGSEYEARANRWSRANSSQPYIIYIFCLFQISSRLS